MAEHPANFRSRNRLNRGAWLLPGQFSLRSDVLSLFLFFSFIEFFFFFFSFPSFPLAASPRGGNRQSCVAIDQIAFCLTTHRVPHFLKGTLSRCVRAQPRYSCGQRIKREYPQRIQNILKNIVGVISTNKRLLSFVLLIAPKSVHSRNKVKVSFSVQAPLYPHKPLTSDPVTVQCCAPY